MQQYEVIIPVRNGGQTVLNSIESVLSCPQASKILLTLSDNFSTDGSPWKETLKKYPASQWRVISPPESLGRVEHWTWAFAQAQLPWVKPLMVGDRIDGAFWDWTDWAIKQYPQAGLFFSAAWIIDPSRAHPEHVGGLPADASTTRLYDYAAFAHDGVRCTNRIGALCQALLRADVMRASLPFDPKYPWTADWRFCRRFLQQVPAVQTTARLVRLDLSIPRVSTTWKSIRRGAGEEWSFAAEQARLGTEPYIAAFLIRVKAITTRLGLVLGRRIIPRSVRAFLTSATGMHRVGSSQA